MASVPLDARQIDVTQPDPFSSTPALATPARPIHRTITISKPPFTYLHLALLSSLSTPNPALKDPPIDSLTARAYLTSALEQFLGMTGTAIPIDFLKLEGRDLWIKVPREDASMVVGALSQWVGRDGGASWRVKGRGEWLGGLVAEEGRGLFDA